MAYLSERGFTLLELLISITITGVILVIIMGAFRIGIRAWETGERDVAVHQRQQIVLPLVCRQLSSACWEQIKRKDQAPLYFKGDQQALEFISAVSVIPGNELGNVYVKYRVVENDGGTGETLEIFEQGLTGVKPDTVLFETDTDAFHELLSGVYRIRFAYLKKEDQGEPEWQEQWDPESEKGIPSAVRLTLQADEKAAPVAVIARIFSEQA